MPEAPWTRLSTTLAVTPLADAGMTRLATIGSTRNAVFVGNKLVERLLFSALPANPHTVGHGVTL